MANFRPLQPAPMDEQPPPPPGRPTLIQKPKRTVTLGACVACRKRKSKCDGSRPVCGCCAQKDTECVYELGPNEKPSQAMKRKNEEMQGELSNLRQLYDFLRLRPEQEAFDILRRIRAQTPSTTPSQHIQEIADFVRHEDVPTLNRSFARYQSEPTHSLTLPPLRLALDSSGVDPNLLPFPSTLPLGPEEPPSQRRRHASDTDVSTRSESPGSHPPRTSIEAILHPSYPTEPDEPSDHRLATAKDWTTVTKDGPFLSLLMSGWHTWEYSYYHFLDWEIFLEDMASGRTDFCSELLVNALLATACFQSPLVKDRSRPFTDNIITKFYREARRLWEAEEGQDSLTRVQAALCLFMVLGKHGRDKVGQTFLLEACRIARSLGLFRLSPASAQKPPHVSIQRWERGRAVTAWGLFNFQLEISFTYSFPPIIKTQPPVAIPYEDCAGQEALFRSECTRHILLLECANALVDPEEHTSDFPPRPEHIEVLYLKLKSWFDARPQSLDPNRFPSCENLLTTMQYYVSIARLFQPFLYHDSSIERVRAYCDHAKSVTSYAIRQTRRLLVLQEIRNGWSNTIPLVLHPIMVTSFGSLEEVASQDLSTEKDGNEAFEGLLTCLRALGTLSGYVYYAQPLFRLLTQTCQAMQIPLPSQILRTLDYYQSEEWTKNAVSVVSSQYIADIRKTTTDVDERMDDIISRWSALGIDGSPREAGDSASPSSVQG